MQRECIAFFDQGSRRRWVSNMVYWRSLFQVSRVYSDAPAAFAAAPPPPRIWISGASPKPLGATFPWSWPFPDDLPPEAPLKANPSSPTDGRPTSTPEYREDLRVWLGWVTEPELFLLLLDRRCKGATIMPVVQASPALCGSCILVHMNCGRRLYAAMGTYLATALRVHSPPG